MLQLEEFSGMIIFIFAMSIRFFSISGFGPFFFFRVRVCVTNIRRNLDDWCYNFTTEIAMERIVLVSQKKRRGEK